jgi:hypothetical protein
VTVGSLLRGSFQSGFNTFGFQTGRFEIEHFETGRFVGVPDVLQKSKKSIFWEPILDLNIFLALVRNVEKF